MRLIGLFFIVLVGVTSCKKIKSRLIENEFAGHYKGNMIYTKFYPESQSEDGGPPFKEVTIIKEYEATVEVFVSDEYVWIENYPNHRKEISEMKKDGGRYYYDIISEKMEFILSEGHLTYHKRSRDKWGYYLIGYSYKFEGEKIE